MASETDEKKAAPTTDVTSLPETAIVEESADATLDLLEKYGHTVEPASAAQLKRVRYKLYFSLLPLLILINVWLFIDKATLSYSALLGIMEDTGLTDTEYNNLSTIFYTGYIVAQLPGHYIFQRIPLSKFVSGSIFLWSVLLFLHCTASSYGGLIPLRFFLGVVEATLVPAMEVTMAMFFTPQEYTRIQPIFWASCMGCPLPAGFIAYGLLFANNTIAPWKLFMVVTGSVSLLLAIFSFFYFPDNPAATRFLTIEERVWVIRKVHESTKSSIEQKKFKKSQALEALRDPISWLFLLGAFTLMIANNLQFQQSLIFLKMGVGNLGSTLVSAAGGGFSIVVCITATILLRLVPNKAGYWGALWCMPAVAGGIGMVALDWDNRIGLLACLLLAGNTFGITYIIMLSWSSSSSAGYTKKLMRNVFFMIGYGVSNTISPQIWVAADAPRYYGSWIAQIVVSWVGTPTILLIVRFILKRRNIQRKAWIAEQEALGHDGHGYVERLDENSQVVKTLVDVSLLDLTDLENKYFLYPL